MGVAMSMCSTTETKAAPARSMRPSDWSVTVRLREKRSSLWTMTTSTLPASTSSMSWRNDGHNGTPGRSMSTE